LGEPLRLAVRVRRWCDPEIRIGDELESMSTCPMKRRRENESYPSRISVGSIDRLFKSPS
jgi:hypothetical protein